MQAAWTPLRQVVGTESLQLTTWRPNTLIIIQEIIQPQIINIWINDFVNSRRAENAETTTGHFLGSQLPENSITRLLHEEET